jgi:ribosomal protein S18 acetylase RimI-like enzyme
MRLLDISEQWAKGHKLMDKRHYYLMIIGVDPEFQQQGIGSRLMKVGLDKADAEKLDCFLETVTPEDVRFYQKHDFEVMSTKGFAENSQFWLMKRSSK